ncbi:MAG: bifunctional pyr operon transcriptional regulator/uracil phosphoribosyltransferase PyrR [Oscillospiraceae bacterium]|nr:bifunctional pyr operon transcriptional regulator/uracil phosphoribosyltransferase PyrR [Oscillospiraceae bacterium]
MEREKAIILDEKAMQRAIARISYEILERNKGTDELCIIGIQRRGVYIADRIASKIAEVEGVSVPVGSLDITPHRDDMAYDCGKDDMSDIDFSPKDKKVVLVDDVVYTGRSARAAMEALIKRGRPRCIQLAALVDRGHRELPIHADYVGKNLPTASGERVRVFVTELDGIDKVCIFERDEK